MDRFKKYLLENKSRLDFEEPGELVWIGIEKRISKSKQKTIIVQLLKWTVAASILVLAGIGFYSVIKAGKKDIGTSFAKNIIIPVSVERIKIESTTLNNEVPKKKIRPTKPGILIAKPKKKPAPRRSRLVKDQIVRCSAAAY